MAETPEIGLSLEDFLLFMNRQEAAALAHEELLDRVNRLRLSDELIDSCTRFAKTDYARNLVCRSPELELLVLCWRPGQHSTIHDHGGSLNAIKVHRGELTSRLYEAAEGTPPQAEGPVRQIAERITRPGDELAGIDRQGIHQLANASHTDLITIHVYAPPLMHLTIYSEDAPGTSLRPMRYTLSEDML